MYLLRAVIRIQMKPLSREALSLMEEAFFAMWTEYREMGLVHARGAPRRCCIRVPQRNKQQQAEKKQNVLYGIRPCGYGG